MHKILKNNMIEELYVQQNSKPDSIDIIVAFHNQPDILEECLSRIAKYTSNYKLFLWDNGSDQQTSKIALSHKPAVYRRSTDNRGFIEPNNEMVKLGTSPYIVLLNSDSFVKKDWDKSILGWLQKEKKCGVVGFLGGRISEDGKGFGAFKGNDIDYVHGWCMGIRRSDYQQFGLFSEEFKFAHCEDSDLCFRYKKHGLSSYALHLDLVHHLGAKTIKSLKNNTILEETFVSNHEKFVEKWLKGN